MGGKRDEKRVSAPTLLTDIDKPGKRGSAAKATHDQRRILHRPEWKQTMTGKLSFQAAKAPAALLPAAGLPPLQPRFLNTHLHAPKRFQLLLIARRNVLNSSDAGPNTRCAKHLMMGR